MGVSKGSGIKRRKITIPILLIFVIFLTIFLIEVLPMPNAIGEDKHSVKPKNGFVPDELTAIKIAEAVLIPIYGEEKIKIEKPLKVKLSNEVWIVEGTLSKNMLGGVAVVEISKKDGCILRMSHGK